MVPGKSPVKLLENAPVPVPSVVLVPEISGFCDVLQQTPLAVIALPPSEEILPPPVAPFAVIALIVVVVRTATVAYVENEISFP